MKFLYYLLFQKINCAFNKTKVYKSCEEIEEALWGGGGHNEFYKDSFKDPRKICIYSFNRFFLDYFRENFTKSQKLSREIFITVIYRIL